MGAGLYEVPLDMCGGGCGRGEVSGRFGPDCVVLLIGTVVSVGGRGACFLI